ncbi:MAG: hypothetical protein ACYSR6_11275, partial [Planctomycetota bacterium]
MDRGKLIGFLQIAAGLFLLGLAGLIAYWVGSGGGQVGQLPPVRHPPNSYYVQRPAARRVRGLVGWWKFDEGGGTTAYDSAGKNHGSLVNGPTWTSGRINGALGFDGSDDYVDLGNDSSLKRPLPVTVCAWINGSGNHQCFISLDDHSRRYCGIWLGIGRERKLHVGYGDGRGVGSRAYRRSKTG